MTAPVTLDTVTDTPAPTPAPALSVPAVSDAPATDADAILTAALAPDTPTSPEGDAPSPDAAPEGETEVEVFQVDITLPKRGDGDPGKYELELPNQEVADAIRHTQNEAARVPKLLEKAERYQQAADTVAFLESDPVGGMAVMAQQYPEAGKEFAQLFIQANPAIAAQTLLKLGYQVTAAETAYDLIETRAQLAGRDLKDKVSGSQQKFGEHAVQSRYIETAQDVITSIAGPLPLDATDRKLFETAAAEALSNLYQSNPRAKEPQMVEALQGLVQRFTTRPTPKKVVAQPRNKDGTFTDTKAKNDKFRKLAGGGTSITPLRAEKIRPDVTLDTLFKA